MIQKEEEELLELTAQASRHVVMAQVMRDVYNRIKKFVELLFKARVQWKFMVLAFVLDFSQNLNVPSYSEEQPGETYYFSPLNAYLFGIYTFIHDRLKAFVYLEGEAKKGGNNVASMIIHFLKETFIELKELYKELGMKNDGPIDSIYLFFDNCGGQNKNRFVIRLLHLLVLSGICKNAFAIFLIRGHTKNDCDRMFNLVKINYRKKIFLLQIK